ALPGDRERAHRAEQDGGVRGGDGHPRPHQGRAEAHAQGSSWMSDAPLSRAGVRARAGASLALTILATALAILVLALVGLGVHGRVPPKLPLYAILFVVGYACGHVAIRRAAPNADPAIFPTAALLAGIGFAVIYRLDPGRSTQQTIWMIVGLAAFVATVTGVRDHRQLAAYTYT